MELINSNALTTLATSLFASGLLSQHDIEFIALGTITVTEKAFYIYIKLLHLGKEDCDKLINHLKSILNHPRYSDCRKLYEILSTPCQPPKVILLTPKEVLPDVEIFTSEIFKM